MPTRSSSRSLIASRISTPRISLASERLEEAGERYQAIKPETPLVLKWQWTTDAGFVEKYINTPHCTDESIDALRGKEFAVWEFIGTDAELERLNPSYLGRSVLPVPGHEHLFISKPDEDKQRRAAELIRGLDEYRAANAAAIEQNGCTPLEDALEALLNERDEITGRMLELRPKTMRGLRALTRGLVWGEWSGDIGNRPVESLEDHMIGSIIRALADQSIVA
ncbi:hypothetical protein ACVWZ6_005606 [Bradyrhizobium sp. GM6.1]